MQFVQYPSANQLLAQILSVTALFSRQIEALRVKLAGHQQFHPLHGFYLIDQRRKGYIDADDLASFLNNKIEISTLRLFLNGWSPQRTKMPYFEYLKMVKPYFDTALAETMLSRDHQHPWLSPQDPFQSILEEIVVLVCIMFAELNTLKQQMAKKCLMNTTDIQSILCFLTRVKSREALWKELAKFVREAGYDSDPEELQYIESFLFGEFNVVDHRVIKLLFLPVYPEGSDDAAQKTTKVKAHHSTRPNFLKCTLQSGTRMALPIPQQPVEESLQHLLEQSRATRRNVLQPHMKSPKQEEQLNLNHISQFVPQQASSVLKHHIKKKGVYEGTPILEKFVNAVPAVSHVSFVSHQGSKHNKSEAQTPIKVSPLIDLLPAGNILDNFIKVTRDREDFSDSFPSSSKSEIPFRYV